MTTADAEPASGPVDRSYEIRLQSHHDPETNDMLALDLELRRLGEAWEPFTPSEHTSPFLNFLHSIFACQLAYVRMNATECDLALAHVHGLGWCDTTDFRVHRVHTSFALELAGGTASEDDLAYLRDRCLACPVSVNLAHVPDKDTVVTVGTVPGPVRRA